MGGGGNHVRPPSLVSQYLNPPERSVNVLDMSNQSCLCGFFEEPGPPAISASDLPSPSPHGVWDLTHLGLIRLATTMISLTLAEVFILAPEPIVMATSFSVRV